MAGIGNAGEKRLQAKRRPSTLRESDVLFFQFKFKRRWEPSCGKTGLKSCKGSCWRKKEASSLAKTCVEDEGKEKEILTSLRALTPATSKKKKNKGNKVQI